jgi:hypothetical protein
MVSLREAKKKGAVADSRMLSFIGGATEAAPAAVPVVVAESDLDRIVDPIDEPDAFREHLERLWKETRQRVLAIGRNLMNALEKLEPFPGRFESLVEGLPFSRPIASQMIAIARAVEDKKLLEEEIPPSYSIAYQLTTLSDEEIKRARTQGIVRPDISRKDIIEFKRVQRSSRPRQTGLDLRRLKAQRDRLRQALAEVEDRIHELEGQGARHLEEDYLDGEAVVVEDA